MPTHIYIYIYIIIMSCWQHEFPWLYLSIHLYLPLLPASLPSYIMCPRRADVNKFLLVSQYCYVHVYGSMEERYSSSLLLQQFPVCLYIYMCVWVWYLVQFKTNFFLCLHYKCMKLYLGKKLALYTIKYNILPNTLEKNDKNHVSSYYLMTDELYRYIIKNEKNKTKCFQFSW